MQDQERHVIVGIDGSDHSRRALAWAVAKTNVFGPVTPVLAYSMQPLGDGLGMPSMYYEIDRIVKEDAEERLKATIDGFPGLAERARVVCRSPGPALVSALGRCRSARRRKPGTQRSGRDAVRVRRLVLRQTRVRPGRRHHRGDPGGTDDQPGGGRRRRLAELGRGVDVGASTCRSRRRGDRRRLLGPTTSSVNHPCPIRSWRRRQLRGSTEPSTKLWPPSGRNRWNSPCGPDLPSSPTFAGVTPASCCGTWREPPICW